MKSIFYSTKKGILDGFIKKEYNIDVNTGAILKVEHEDVRDDD